MSSISVASVAGQEVGPGQQFRSYHEALSFLESLSGRLQMDYMKGRPNPEIYLKRLRYFLNLVGNPHRGLQMVHIAGTAGKGSVAGLVHAMLVAHAEPAGLFTSPSPTTAIEGIQEGEYYIAPDEFARIVQRLRPAVEQAYAEGPYGGPSPFEVLLTVALRYFHGQGCRWAVLEAGLGGRYDATNVIENPVVTAITNVDYDHTDILGETLEEIAWDKAGIIKAKSHFWTTETRPQILQLLRRICRENGATFFRVPGNHSRIRERNLALATSIGQDIGLSPEAARDRLARFRLPCRFELVQRHPQVVLDGAHNAVKMDSTVADLRTCSYDRLYLVIGILQGKDAEALLARVTPLADVVYVTSFEHPERQCIPPATLATLSSRFQRPTTTIHVVPDARTALSAALDRVNPADLVLVTGSFSLAGKLRTLWYPKENILVRRQSF